MLSGNNCSWSSRLTWCGEPSITRKHWGIHTSSTYNEWPVVKLRWVREAQVSTAAEQAHMIRHQLAVLKISFIITPRPRKLPPFFSDDIFKYIFFYILIQFSLKFSQVSSWQWVRIDSDKGLKFERSSWQRVGIGSDDSLARKAMCTTWTNDDLSKHTDVHVYMHHSTQLNTVHVPVYHLNDIIATASPSPERLKLSHWQPLELLQ